MPLLVNLTIMCYTLLWLLSTTCISFVHYRQQVWWYVLIWPSSMCFGSMLVCVHTYIKHLSLHTVYAYFEVVKRLWYYEWRTQRKDHCHGDGRYYLEATLYSWFNMSKIWSSPWESESSLIFWDSCECHFLLWSECHLLSVIFCSSDEFQKSQPSDFTLLGKGQIFLRWIQGSNFRVPSLSGKSF